MYLVLNKLKVWLNVDVCYVFRFRCMLCMERKCRVIGGIINFINWRDINFFGRWRMVERSNNGILMIYILVILLLRDFFVFY